jgi:D-inositol-3-phosphate glycosyltransferase
VIAGGKLREDKDLQQLRQLACDLQIEQQVRFLGAQPRDKMPWFYSAADVTVVPSYHETFGLAAVESLACGTPVVATRSGGLMTVVKHGVTGFLVPRWPSAFAERIDQLLSDHALWSRMSAAARPSIEQFGWSSVAQQIYKVYDEMVCEGYSQVAL